MVQADERTEVRYLLNLLRSSGHRSNKALHMSLIGNLVYYVPRLKDPKLLAQLANALFDSTLWFQEDVDPSGLLDMAQGMFYWKLEISEPTLPIEEFYSIWNNIFCENQGWSVYKLAILSGACSTLDRYTQLQSQYYIVESPRWIDGLYQNWKYNIFLRSWSQFLSKSSDDSKKDVPRIEVLCLLYCPISRHHDVSRCHAQNVHFPLSFVIIALINLAIVYAIDHPPEDEFLSRNINQVARTLQILLPQCDNPKEISMVLDELCVACFNISYKESSSDMPNKDYSGVKYYSNTLLTFTLIFKGILDTKMKKPKTIFYQILTCMYYLNFIALDFGTIGFESYEYTHNASIAGITSSGDQLTVYSNLLSTFNNNIWHTLKYPNKINDAKLLFLLDFLKRSIEITSLDFGSRMSTSDFINNTILPLKMQYLNSQDETIRDSMHSVMLAVFLNNSSGYELMAWQRKSFLNYLSTAVEQYVIHNMLKPEQIIHIYQSMAFRMTILDKIKLEDEECTLVRETLNYTYLQVKNAKFKEQKITLLKCLIYMIPYINHAYILVWLNNIMQLFDQELGVTTPDDQQLLYNTLWEVIPLVKSTDAALIWWYSTIVPRIRHSKL